MKRRYFAILLMAALLVSCFAVSALATQAQLNYVTDEAGLFTDTERGTLESRAQEISERYNFGVYIITLPDYRDYTTSSSVETCAMGLYDDNTLGWGSDRAGTMLLLSMQERDFDLDFYSSRANRIFTEVGRDRMEDRFIPYFRNDNFYGGYMEYLNTCEEYLQAAEEGHPVGEGEQTGIHIDVHISTDGVYPVGEGESRYSGQDEKASPALALIPGGIAALLVGIFTSAPMHSAKQQRDANQYVRGRLNLRRRSDMFLNRTVSRSPRNTESRSSGSSGGSHSHSYSSGGHSGRSGKF